MTLQEIFALVCGQGRCFVVAGEALPVCERCLGLYLGAAVTAICLVAAGTWRRGLPSRGVFLANLAVLVLALLGGVHALDPGQTWRVACGAWTGYVATLWLAGAANQLRDRHNAPTEALAWRGADKLAAVLALALGTAAALAIRPLLELGWAFWATVAAVGCAALWACAAWAVLALCCWCARVLAAGRKRLGPRTS